MSDRGYINLLSHLNRSATTLPLTTIQASIAHYLAHSQPTPTSFTAIVISSPLFRPFSQAKLEALVTAFRHGVHVEIKLLKGEESSLFSRSITARTSAWVHGVLKGLQGGQAMLRLACYGGLLLGLEDWETELTAKESRMRRRVEEELVVSLAEVMDMYPYMSASSGWESEFRPSSTFEGEGNPLSMAFLLASKSLPLVASHRLKALPLRALTSSLLATIDNAFQSGTFLSTLRASTILDQSGQVSIHSSSSFVASIQKLTSSPILTSMAPLSRMCARSLSALADSRPKQGWLAMSETMQKLETLTRSIETDWVQTPLAGVVDENGIAPDSREFATAMWNVLKTVLFMGIMVVQSVLSTLVYVPQPTNSSPSPSAPTDPTPYSFALTALHIFSHLSFVIPQFGGVTSTSQGGFPELKKVFYTALDILSADPEESQRFVRELCDNRLGAYSPTLPAHFLHAKKAYTLACIEQLIPVLHDEAIQTDVFPACAPHLSDPSHRETYESAHSVMLAVFASHAQKANEGKPDQSQTIPTFAEQIVPFYVQCLIDNSKDGCLMTSQLCLAYAALVRSAGSFGIGSASKQPSVSGSVTTDGDAFAWFCIEALLRSIRNPVAPDSASPSSSTPSSSSSSSSSLSSSSRYSKDHIHRLHLTLIATVPSVSLALLPKLLEEIRLIIESHSESGGSGGGGGGEQERRGELVQALFKGISENVGDLQKEFAMTWWYDNKGRLNSSSSEIPDAVGVDSGQGSGVKGKGKAVEQEVVSRL